MCAKTCRAWCRSWPKLCPHVQLRLQPPIGEDERMTALMADIASEEHWLPGHKTPNH